ncbi:MAG: Chromosomal replication initiator protein DnaA [Candidatus Amesbacteria bacterium GW2011_GWA1_47_20]|uniref:Chromosomal replication initiator protein DnaA n=1 Tax=Candidatus Amesbacteria bacterium GW2011_GWA1_47_20 TaxID=1618354 RepID=A0A0G1SI73_9BACT|nr:MAG: Chromosomal replication initiator protein DnaA [Candidatus Amesbacteria bacterium GW2011_GWA1_47_20]
MDRDVTRIWKAVLEGMKVAVSSGTFNALIRQTELVALSESGGKFICEVGCSSGMTKTLLEQRFYGQLAEELKRVTEKECEIRFVVQSRRAGEQESKSDLPLFTEVDNSEEVRRARLRLDFTFDNYAVSGSNQMAHAAAMAVAKKPGTAYNPLFIYGGGGGGKTHLMQAVGRSLLERGEGPVLFCTGEEFTNDLVMGIRNKDTDRVRAKYRKVKALLIDDVQFIAGKASVQEEFFHTFNSIVREGGQIVMTSDKSPAEIAKLEERLRSRFGAGMIVDVGPADFELRTAILLIKAKQRGRELDMNVAQAVASHVEGVRELEGVLMRLTTESEIKNEPITVEMAERLLKISKLADGVTRIVTPNEVINLISGYFGVGVQQLKGEKRTKTIAWPRQILMHLLRTDLELPLEEVGRLIGGRDHTTVMHADKKVIAMMQSDQSIHNQIGDIRKKMLTSQ